MRRIARRNADDRTALFRNTAAKTGLSAAIVEKDFWVCWTLDQLFHRCPWSSSFVFKGGTSLSKGFDLIKRFSEDIDLILDWRILGYATDEPWRERSNTRQDAFNEEANHRAAAFLAGELLPRLSQAFSDELGTEAGLRIDPDDPQTVKFAYPRTDSDPSILQEIRMEIGALPAWTPSAPRPISPYAASVYGALFEAPSTSVPTVLPERSFWEKATILHREAFRAETGVVPARYSRHYYDLWSMSGSDVCEHALAQPELLAQVVRFKAKFYRCPWARYDLAAKPSGLRLVPKPVHARALAADYAHMRNMIFGTIPDFDTILARLERLQSQWAKRTD